MKSTDTDSRKGIAPLADRDVRALTECMTVLDDTPTVCGADGIYKVVSQSGQSYTVDAYGKSCTCPDACHNDHVCKHQRRVMFACGMHPIPGGLNRDAFDDHLGEQVAATPRVGQVVTDGGPSLARDPDDEADTARPTDCACTGKDGTLVCWPYYRDGFETPNPDAEEGGEE